MVGSDAPPTHKEILLTKTNNTMNIKVKATELAKALQIAKASQTGKQPLPIYEASFLHICGGDSTLEAHSASAHVSLPIKMEASEEAVIAVNTA